MAKLVPCLNVSGKCKEALAFCKEVFGGDLDLRVVKDSPAAQQMPPEMHDMVMHSSLTAGDLVINASDMMREQPSEGNSYWLAIHGDSEAARPRVGTEFGWRLLRNREFRQLLKSGPSG